MDFFLYSFRFVFSPFSINIFIGPILFFHGDRTAHACFTCNAPMQLELVIIHFDFVNCRKREKKNEHGSYIGLIAMVAMGVQCAFLFVQNGALDSTQTHRLSYENLAEEKY